MCIALRSRDLLLIVFVPQRNTPDSDVFSLSILLQHLGNLLWLKFLWHRILLLQPHKYLLNFSNVLRFLSFVFTKLRLLYLVIFISLIVLAAMLSLPGLVIVSDLLELRTLAFEKASRFAVLSRYQQGEFFSTINSVRALTE